MSGMVYLVGAGPGAADLLTVRAARLLAQADVVLHDALVGSDVLALAANAKLYNVGKRAGRPSVDQRFICRFLIRMASRYATVVRLKGGDPSIFGRAEEELEACREHGVPVAIVPGITAATAAVAALGAPLTARGVSRSLAFVTPTVARHDAESEHWADAAAAADTAVVYMGASRAQSVAAALMSRGVPAQRSVALIENASSANERIMRGVLSDLGALAAETGDGPVVMIIGEAVAASRAVVAAENAA